jgi:transcription elongation factor Elf1
MKLCPKCNASTKESERIERDLKKKDKHWLITYCARCGFNFDIDVYTGEIISPEQEMDKYPHPPPLPQPPSNWYGYQ